MTTSISSEAVWNYKKYAWTTENLDWGGREIAFPCFYIVAFCSQTDGQNIYRIDAYIWEECAEKKIDICFN